MEGYQMEAKRLIGLTMDKGGWKVWVCSPTLDGLGRRTLKTEYGK